MELVDSENRTFKLLSAEDRYEAQYRRSAEKEMTAEERHAAKAEAK